MTCPTQRLGTVPPRQLSEPELRHRMITAFPELSGPGVDTESGAVLYGQPPHPRIGTVPVQAGASVAEREAEAAERLAREAALPPEIRAAKALIEAEQRQQQQGRRWP
jgi:hypothetical protein